MIRLMSWNTLAAEYVKPEKYPLSSEQDLDWSRRSKLILKEIQDSRAQIVCLQEVQVSYWQDFSANCQKIGYDCQILQNVTRQHPVALAILLKPNVVEVLAVESRSRAILTVMRLRSTNQLLVLANVHLQAGFQSDEDRYNQIKSLLKRIRNQARRFELEDKDTHIILIGDFNMKQPNPIYHLLSTGKWPALQKIKNTQAAAVQVQQLPYLPLIDAYEKHIPKDGRVRATFRSGCVLDYVFTSQQVETIPWRSHPDASLQRSLHPWPNAFHPSDHLPIGVDLYIRQDVVVDSEVDQGMEKNRSMETILPQ
jgi:CCR4-NOT transcription complex subunit 6